MTRPLCKSAQYQQERAATIQEVEALVASCYPVVQEHVQKLEKEIRNKSLRKRGKILTEAAAHELIMRLIAATNGEILV